MSSQIKKEIRDAEKNLNSSHDTHIVFTAPFTLEELRLAIEIWETGLVPAQWKRAVVIPILKKNKDPKQLSSYRPISLTSILGKTMEKLILNRLNWYLEDKI
ncbi:hypothetical protein CEXT_84141 [Caerostris extrusa]|uniref:Reverse transcriptase domain-containing protein n=1 Tax=Caerostris extrusa TaxID=172846 RepID=A0AAV4NIX1_CAEEX|nr:hypothetical protein CEXT_84141 [Caerostris extrusa]